MESNISNETGSRSGKSPLEKVLDRKEILENIIDHSPVIAFLWTADNTPEEKWPVEYVSANVTQLGYTVEDFISGRLHYADIVYGEDLRRVQLSLEKSRVEGKSFFDQEYRIVLESGDIRWVDERTYLQRDENGNVTHYQGTIFDITDQKNNEMLCEKALKEQKNLEDIINNSSTMVFLWRAEEFWPADYASANVSRLGFSAEDFVLGRIVYGDLIHPDDYNAVKDELEQRSREGYDDYIHEYRLLTKAGELLWVNEKTFIKRDVNGNVTHFQGIVQDITKQKLSEIALDEALVKQNDLLSRKQALETIVNHSPVVAFLWKAGEDDEKELWPVEFVSDNITQFGYDVDDFLSGDLLYGNIIHADDLPEVQLELSDICNEGGKMFVKEYRILTRSGDIRWVDEQTFIQRDNEGKVTDYQGVIQDITERKESGC
ncbi:PAS domain-containing protein [Methanococcoides alaskense]|uniref:histidine kinase n=1 Tax=Methanococcoides alaskense TaxID=325778 RepID=A0AA90U0G8_9EURY|nr:PAS domain-containing protein [Methanococcoides alaskense]MDA0524770.1 PAS domain-containing protein [Methanococcoides alaskense]MDR6223109.1 PAS domain S-box-containing protein [Methanococcoides alaskense]